MLAINRVIAGRHRRYTWHGMKRSNMLVRIGWLAACASLWFGVAVAQDPASQPDAGSAPAPATVKVILKTSLGDIVIAVETQRAPITAANFLRYVDQKRLDGSEFYRSRAVGEEGQCALVQGGLRGTPKRVFKPIAHEPTTATGLSHVNG